MNRVKFRPVGQPNGPVRVVKVTQRRAGFEPRRKNGAYVRAAHSLASATRLLFRQGWVRVNQ